MDTCGVLTMKISRYVAIQLIIYATTHCVVLIVKIANCVAECIIPKTR